MEKSQINDIVKSMKMTYVVFGAIVTGIVFAVKVLTHQQIVDNRLNSTKTKVKDLQLKINDLESKVNYQQGIIDTQNKYSKCLQIKNDI